MVGQVQRWNNRLGDGWIAWLVKVVFLAAAVCVLFLIDDFIDLYRV
jgi:hypothetical protein